MSKKRINDIKRKNLIEAFLFASIAFACMIFMGPTQDTGDDALLVWQLSRETGSLASFLSPYLSLVFGWLYDKIPVAWWSLFSIGSGYVLLLVVYNLSFKRYKGVMRIANVLIWAVLVWLAIVEKMNFTRTATAYALAGIILVLEKIIYYRKNYWMKWILGICLLLIGAMCRFQAALLVLPFFLIVLVYKYFWLKNKSFSKFLLFVKSNFIAITGPLVCLLLLVFMNNIYWNTHQDWKEYNHYNQVRSEIADYIEYYPSWEEGKNEYQKLGLKEKNDLDLLFTWVFVGDTEVYSTEILEKIVELKREIPLEERIHGMSNRIQEMLSTGRVLKWIILYAMIYMFMIGKKTFFPILLSMSCATAVLVVFSFLGRMMLRVWEPTLLCSAMVFLVIFKTQEKHIKIVVRGNVFDPFWIKKDWLLGIVVIIIFTYCVQKFLCLYQIPSYDNDRDNITRTRAEYINENQENLYLLAQPLIHHSPNPSIFGIWEPIKKDFCLNYFALSNWEARTPYNIKRLEKMGIENPVKALYERTDTYSIFDAQLYEFLKCHYDAQMTCSIIDFFEDTGGIVQYTKPITKYNSETNASFNFVLENCHVYDMISTTVTGKIEKDLDIDALYLNVMLNGKMFSYRLNYEKNGVFNAVLYGLNSQDMQEYFFVAKNGKEDYIRINNFIKK